MIRLLPYIIAFKNSIRNAWRSDGVLKISKANGEQKISTNLTEKKVKEALESGYGQSEALLNDKDELDTFLHRLEQKIKELSFVGEKFTIIPIMISLVKNYVEGKYTKIPYGTILAILNPLVYFLSPIDIFPDFLPFAGYLDDMAVMELSMKMVKTDIEAYDEWRRSQGRI